MKEQTMKDQKLQNRRVVRFANVDEIVDDAERLLPSHATVGNWTFGQICQHLARNIDGSIDGFDFQAPWFARRLIAPLVKKSMMSKPLSAGFRLPPQAKPVLPENDVSAEEGLRQLNRALERLQRETPNAAHPFLGMLSPDEWTQLHLRHAELHFSFIVPRTPGGF